MGSATFSNTRAVLSASPEMRVDAISSSKFASVPSNGGALQHARHLYQLLLRRDLLALHFPFQGLEDSCPAAAQAKDLAKLRERTPLRGGPTVQSILNINTMRQPFSINVGRDFNLRTSRRDEGETGLLRNSSVKYDQGRTKRLPTRCVNLRKATLHEWGMGSSDCQLRELFSKPTLPCPTRCCRS